MNLQRSESAKKRRRYEEFEHQKAFFEWANRIQVPEGGFLADYAWHNVTSRTGRDGAILKLIGQKAGIPDVTIILPRGRYHGAFLELKRSTNYSLTKEQKPMINLLNRLGYFARVSPGIDRTMELVKEYLKL